MQKACLLLALALVALALHAQAYTLSAPASSHASVTKSISGSVATFNKAIHFLRTEATKAVKLAGAAQGSDDVPCEVCKGFLTVVDDFLRLNSTDRPLDDIAAMICERGHIYGGNPEVCVDMIREMTPEIAIILTVKLFEPEHVCSRFGFCPQTTVIPDSIYKPRPRPTKEQCKTDHFTKPLIKNKSKLSGTFVQITDVHFDELYVEGMSTQCGQPICCRAHDGPGSKAKGTVAGPFGDYNCDLPLASLLEAKKVWASLDPRPDFVVWTGDDPPHDVWEQSREKNLRAAKNVTDIIREAFGDIPVIPAIGNHESFPVNMFEGPGHDSWLYDTLADLWSHWLSPEAQNELRYGGFYSQLVLPGHRIVSLNTQYAYPDNFWLIVNGTDPADQLKWLRQVLVNASACDETVYLIGHIPFGNGDFKDEYGLATTEMLNEFRDNIVSSFFGHTHSDSFHVARDTNDETPLSVMYVAPSLTTMTNRNPSFRVYHYDTTTYQVLDYDQYSADISKANKEGVLKFDRTYSAKQFYGLKSMAPSEWQNLIARTATDPKLFEGMFKNYHTQRESACGSSCMRSFLCGLTSANGQQQKLCAGKSY